MAQKNMFCYQCEQTAKGEGCTVAGVCGKSPDVAALQDLLVYSLRGLALYALEGIKKGVKIPGQDVFTAESLFATLTNVNFDQDRFPAYINKAGRSSRSQVGPIGSR
jgi:hydroxylamine reductase